MKRIKQQSQQMEQTLAEQTGQLANAPMLDPSKNPNMLEQPMEGAEEEFIEPPQ